MPRHHEADFGRATDAQLTSAAETLQKVLRLLDVLDGPPYNLVLHTAPLQERVDETYHWHWEIHPRLREIAGLELGTGLPVNPVSPEAAVAELLAATEAPADDASLRRRSGMRRDAETGPVRGPSHIGHPERQRTMEGPHAWRRPRGRPSPGPFLERTEPSVSIAEAAIGIAAMTRDRATARAFVEQLFRLHHGEIYAYLSRMVRDNELAADLAQETFVKAYRAFDSARGSRPRTCLAVPDRRPDRAR